ncbi:MAG: hypothetical protein QME66_01745 [Candidatus Eisenbacteria bacterium]|nr:hypothetical protein [Candidatus Eisenbacteria bacterium]
MSTGEMLFLICAMALLSTLILSVNTSLFQANDFASEGTIGMYAVSVAQQYVEMARQLKYDETTVSGYPSNPPAGFTMAGRLGKDTGESYPDFDDVDDFNNFALRDSTSFGKCAVSIDVAYVNENDPTQTAQGQTYAKRMTVTVSSPFLRAPLRLSHVFTYFEK